MNRRSFLALAAIAVALRKMPESAKSEGGLLGMVCDSPSLDNVTGSLYDTYEELSYEEPPTYEELAVRYWGHVRINRSAHGAITGLTA